jgi:hypothetical protein
MRAPMLFALSICASMVWPVDGFSQTTIDYSSPSSWLCLPGRSDSCSAPLTSTVIPPGKGGLSNQTYTLDPAAPIDCFYVYPTVSQDATANADMTPGPEEEHVAEEQFARFGAKCKTFAPLYRQITVAAMIGHAPGANRQLAYRDVLDA